MMKSKTHIPAPEASGLRGPALCGRFASYGTHDHQLCRRLALESINQGDSGYLCARCARIQRERTARGVRVGF